MSDPPAVDSNLMTAESCAKASAIRPTTPTRAARLADASVDPTEARNDIRGCFGRSDRRAQPERSG